MQGDIVDGKAVHKVVGIRDGLLFHALGQAQEVSGLKLVGFTVDGIAGFSFYYIGYFAFVQYAGQYLPVGAAFAKNLIRDSRHKIVGGFSFHPFSPML
jgi:hypothetical protein